MTYKPGKYLYVADTLSRSYLQETKEQLVSETEINAINPKSYLPISPEKYAQFQRETAKDLELKALSSVILKGRPDNREDVSPAVRQYWSYRDELTCLDGLLFKGDKIIVPKTLQSEMLEEIHETYLGIVKCKNRARQVLFWPGMSACIEETIAACALCAEHSRANAKEPLILMEIPERLLVKVRADLFEFNNQHYLLIVDNLSAKNVISYMKSQISRYGIPDELISDNGPQFTCEEFAQFMKDYDIKHITSSPYHPQANGQVERTVQTVKRLLVKAKDPYKALLDYRNSPLDTGFSPAQLFLGRRLKTTLPTTSKLLQPGHGNSKERHTEMVSRQQKQKFYFDKKASGNLLTFRTGDPVMMKFRDTRKRAEVVTPHSTPRSYVVRHERKQYRRNRRMLRPAVVASRDSDLPVKQNVWLIKQVVRLHHNQMTTAKWSEKKMW